MGLSSDEDELNVVDSLDDDAAPRKIKSVGSSGHADRSDLSTTPQSNDESHPMSVPIEHRKRQTDSVIKRSRTQKRHLNESAVMEKRLIEKLTQENQRLKTELEARAHQRFANLPPQSVIVSSGSTGQRTSTPLVHPTPASNPLPFFGFPSAQVSQPPAPTTQQIQSSGSAFSVPQGINNTRPLDQLDPATFSLFYSPFGATTNPSLMSLFGGNGQIVGGNDLTSLNNLHSILQQQNNQQSLFPNFATDTTTSTQSTNAAPLSQLIHSDPLLSILQQNNPSAFSTFRGGIPSISSSDPSQEPNMRFSALFQQPTNTTNQLPDPQLIEGHGTSKRSSHTKQHKSRKGPSPETSTNESKVMARGPGNVQFVNQLPTAQEPRPSVLVHTDETQPKSTSWSTSSNTSQTRKSPQQKRDKNSPRSSSAFSALPDHSGSQFNTSNNERPHSLLGSLLATSSSRRSPSVPESRTEKQSGLVDQLQRADQDRLKSCLTSLAVNLSTSSTNHQPTVACSRSDNDSMGSPHSTRSTRSTTDSNRSQTSPPLGSNGQDTSSNAQTSTTEGPSDGRVEHERFQYMDRRRRNNEAAKRCRANRRAVFEYRSRRAQQLEAENTDLRQEMLKLNNELEQLKAVIAANSRMLAT